MKNIFIYLLFVTILPDSADLNMHECPLSMHTKKNFTIGMEKKEVEILEAGTTKKKNSVIP